MLHNSEYQWYSKIRRLYILNLMMLTPHTWLECADLALPHCRSPPRQQPLVPYEAALALHLYRLDALEAAAMH